jgi:hypothetical protein
MTEKNHRVDQALRKLAGVPEPSEQDRQTAEKRLAAAIDSEAKGSERRPWGPVLVWATRLTIVLVALLSVLQIVRPSPTEAAIGEIASIAEAADPLTVPDQQFIYTKSEITGLGVIPREGLGDVPFEREQLVYLLPVLRESWVGNDGTIQIRTTSQTPVFFSHGDEQAYYTAGLDQQDAIGQTITQTATGPADLSLWPPDKDDLDEAIRAAAADRGLPETIEYLDVALDLIRETFASPQLRANTLRLIGELPGLQFVGTSTDGTTTFAIEYADQGIETRLTFILTREGYLLTEERTVLEEDPVFGIPANTTVSSATYTTPRVVSSLQVP